MMEESVWSFSSRTRLMVFAPHPDDETLSTGGLLQTAAAAGAQVRVVFVTDGDNNPWAQRLFEHRWTIGPDDRKRWGAMRRREALNALLRLGIPPASASFLGYPDQGMTGLLLSGIEIPVLKLALEMAQWRPTLVVAPSIFDLHPDHSAIGVLLSFALPYLGAGPGHPEVIRYLSHTRGPRPKLENTLEMFLTPEQTARKRLAILCHATQLKAGRRRLLEYADGGVERFIRDARDPAGPHPIRRVFRSGEEMEIEIVSRSQLGAFGPRSVYFACGGGIPPLASRSVRLCGKSARVPVRDETQGKVLALARSSAGGGSYRLSIPLSGLPLSPKVFAKLERRFGFFDEAGWYDISAVCRAPVGPRVRGPEGIDGKDGPARSGPAVCCVIPCYNAQDHCEEVLLEATRFSDHVIAVNDGSSDATGEILDRAAAGSHGRIHIVSLDRNQGKGVALIRGFRHALRHLEFEVLVTLDADRQHRPADVPRLVEALMRDDADMAIGERTVEPMRAPLRSRIGNLLATWTLQRAYPQAPYDTQSGMRAFRRGFVQELAKKIGGGRYETEAYILLMALELGKRITTVPIRSVYLDGNISSHFRPLKDALRIYKAHWNFRRLASSGILRRSCEGFFIDFPGRGRLR